jgi:hypothetical protein
VEKWFKNGRGRVEDRGERPGEVASERTGLLEQTTLDEQKHNETWGSTTPHPNAELWGLPSESLAGHPGFLILYLL